MRTHAIHILWPMVLLAGAGCGAIDNRPLRVGTVRGTVNGSDGTGLIFVFGEASVRTPLGPGGEFELAGVPAGAGELIAIASGTLATRFPVEVHGGRVTEIGPVAPAAAAFVELEVSTPSGQSPEQGVATIQGTPYEGMRLTYSGGVHLGPLAAGRYTLDCEIPGLGLRSAEFELEPGEDRKVLIAFPPPDGSEGEEGCARSGCSGGLRCAPDGSCVQCLSSEHCADGLSCSSSRCVGEVVACEQCTEDWQCGTTGAKCESVGSEGHVCTYACDPSSPCRQNGTVCQSNRCVPDPARMQSCGAYRSVGAACSGDPQCQSLGLVSGACVGGSCTYACSSDRECPTGTRCIDLGGGTRYCRDT